MIRIRLERKILNRNNHKFYGFLLVYSHGGIDVKLQLTKTELMLIKRLIKQELDNEPYLEPVQNKTPDVPY